MSRIYVSPLGSSIAHLLRDDQHTVCGRPTVGQVGKGRATRGVSCRWVVRATGDRGEALSVRRGERPRICASCDRMAGADSVKLADSAGFDLSDYIDGIHVENDGAGSLS